MKLLMVIDIGTTAVKVSLFDTAMNMHKCNIEEYKLITDNNRVELPPEVYWEAVKRSIIDLTGGISDQEQIISIGITTQGETLIPVDKKGAPLHNAVVWLDGRATEQAEYIRNVIDDKEFYTSTGVPVCDGLCPISKLLWFKEEEPEIYANTAYFLLLEDYIIYKFTGRIVTEKTLLSTTGYFHIVHDAAWTEIMTRLELDLCKIPPILDCGQVVGMIIPELSKELGLNSEVKVLTTAMDQVAGAVGAGNIHKGIVTETTGTALCIGLTVERGNIDLQYRIPVYRHYDDKHQLMLTVSMTAGMTLKWFKDVFCQHEIAQAKECGISVYEVLDQMAEKAKPLSGGVIMLPYLSGITGCTKEFSIMGSFTGITLDSTKDDFVRAILEGVAYMLQENLDDLKEASGEEIKKVISLGGGSKSTLWNQIKANIIDRPLEVPDTEESTSKGAAMLCAVGLGLYRNMDEIFMSSKSGERQFLPDEKQKILYRNGFQHYMNTKNSLLGQEHI